MIEKGQLPMMFQVPEQGAEVEEITEDEMTQLQDTFWLLQLINRGRSRN